MAEIHHHPDGLVYVRTDGAAYVDTLANFQADAGAAGLPKLPALPEGLNERRYVQGVKHALYGRGSQVGAPEGVDWSNGDAIIAGVDALLTAQANRGGADPAPTPEPSARIVRADVFRDRFTDAELVGVLRAAQTDDAVALYWAKATTTGTVNLNSATVDAGLDLLISKGLLASKRKAEVLA